MKIALVAPLVEAVPPAGYGGTERVVGYLADALVDAGHDVTLFASADSRTKARLAAARHTAIRLDPAPHKSDLAAHLSMLDQLRARADEFDVLHFHIDLLHFPFFESIAHRTLTTLHGRLDIKDLPQAYRRWSRFPLASISRAQRRALPRANWIATVHHGEAVERFPFGAAPERRDPYVAFLGRVSPEKRVDRAIEIARHAGVRLKIIAKVDAADQPYFRSVIEPLLDAPHVEFVGELAERERNEVLAGALALLFPIDWPEPFGLAMIESMACGTPVIAWNCGSVPEVVDEGVTGFVVDSERAAVEALARVTSLDRRRVRATFERRFSAERMASEYVALYQRLADHRERAPAEEVRRSAVWPVDDPPLGERRPIAGP